MEEDSQSKYCQLERTIHCSKIGNQAHTSTSECGETCQSDNPPSGRLELAGTLNDRKHTPVDNQTNLPIQGAGPHIQTDNQTVINGSDVVKSSSSLVQSVQLDNVSFIIEKDSHMCQTDVNVLRKLSSENEYRCGACSRRFQTICYLHDHLKASHQSGGSYHYNHYLHTAFPKYDSCCQYTQTASQNSGNEEGKTSFDNVQTYENTSKQDGTKFVIHLPDRVSNNESKALLELSGASQNDNQQSEIWSVSTRVLELVKTEQDLKDNDIGLSGDADYNSDGTDDYFDEYSEMEESAIDTKYHIGTETVENHHTAASSSSLVEKINNVKTRKRKQATPKSIKTDQDNISGNVKEVIKQGGKKSVLKIETDKLPANKPLEDPIPDGNCECDICGATFSFKRGLLRHEQMKHLDSMKHKCQFCDQKFMREFNLQKHIKCVHTIGQGQKYKEKYRAKKRGEKDKEKTVYVTKSPVEPKVEQTDIEKVEVKVKKECKKKVENSSNAPHTCSICGHTMPRSKMDVHQRLHSGERPFICHVCGKGLISQNKLKRHMLIHSEVKKHTCDICGAGFQMKYKLRMHQHIHTGKKPYLCSICGAEFNHSSNLATHTRCVHLQIKPFECPTCGGRYAKRSQLDDHVLSHSTEKQYTCRYCGKSFKYYKGMRRHEKNHYEEKSFKCDQCDCRFARRDNLERHKLSHQEPSLECKTCKKMFRDKRLLRDHEYSHTGVKQYQCVLCGEGYKAANQYYTHMLAAHGMDKEQAKLMQEERQTKVTVPQSVGKHSMVQVDPNLPLRLDAEPNQDPVKTASKTDSTSINVNQMVTGIMEENRAAINVLTRVATQNLRLHSEDIQEEEKLNVIVPPLNPMILLERNQGFSSLTGANNMNVSVENTGSSSSTSFVMLTPLSQSREGLQIQQTGNLVSGNLQIPQRQSITAQLDDNLRHSVESRTTNFGSLQMAVNNDNGALTPDSVHSAYSIQDARMTLESLTRQHETVSVPLTLMRLSENMMDPPAQRQAQEAQEQTNQQAGSGAYRIQNMF